MRLERGRDEQRREQRRGVQGGKNEREVFGRRIPSRARGARSTTTPASKEGASGGGDGRGPLLLKTRRLRRKKKTKDS